MIRSRNQLLAIACDATCALVALWLGFALRYGDWQPDIRPFLVLFPLASLFVVANFYYAGVYRLVVRHLRITELVPLVQGFAISALLVFAAAFVMRVGGMPRSVPFLFMVLGVMFTAGARLLAQAWFARASGRGPAGARTLVYGAGFEGVQLAALLRQGRTYLPVGFIDADPQLQGRYIHGCRVYPPDEIDALVVANDIAQIVVATPARPRAERVRVLESLAHLNIPVLVPAEQGGSSFASFTGEVRQVELADLLERDPAHMDTARVAEQLQGSVVLVSGAGGSIGSEVCRQLMQCRLRTLVLLDHSEYALWSIHRELERHQPRGLRSSTQLIPVLGDVGDPVLLDRTLRTHEVQYLYHAAAYKHVHMLQANPVAAITNNSLTTWRAARVAARAGLKGFLLVSTDKAVKPSSLLGVSKLVAEMAVQLVARRYAGDCCFCAFRFGNVLGSSGSVVPLFSSQIDRGGPIEITHPDATRYLMTIPEAAQLILEASLFGEQGATYVLEMGQPVRIADLAQRLMRLKGYGIDGPAGRQSIEIEYTGLRPGEKMHEELVHAGRLEPTSHDHIRRVREPAADLDGIEALLQQLQQYAATRDEAAILATLAPHLRPSVPDAAAEPVPGIGRQAADTA